MIFSLLGGGNPVNALISLLLSTPIILLALSLHETAHGYVAYKCGDYTAYNLGRLTLNPIKHLDLFGFLSMLLIGYGWAKPVPVNTRNFRNPKRDMALSALAGPVSNLLLGAVCAVLTGICWGFCLGHSFGSEMAYNFLHLLSQALFFSAQINFLFAFFNLIPIPPFDGSRVALLFLPTKFYFGIMRYERQILFGVLIAIIILNRFDLSPFSFLAESLTDAIYLPITKAIVGLLV